MGEVVQFTGSPRTGGRGLTLKQRKALRFILAHIKLHGAWPHLEAVAKECGIMSTKGTERTISPLVERGLVPERQP